MICRLPRAACAAPTPRSARLLLSLPQLVNTSSFGAQFMMAAIRRRASSRAVAARRPRP